MFIKQMDCTDRSTGPDIGLWLSAGLHIEELLSQERERRENLSSYHDIETAGDTVASF